MASNAEQLAADLSHASLNDSSTTRYGSKGPQRQEGGQDPTLTLRALVSTKEAGIIIGKAGKNVAELRQATGVKAGVSKAVPGVVDRILSLGGPIDGIAKAFELITGNLLEGSNAAEEGISHSTQNKSIPTTVRLLVAHSLMGSIIGKQGANIKQIQDMSSVRMVAAKEMLPQSTERIVEISGTPQSIGIAIKEIAICLSADLSEKSAGTILYHPGVIGPDGLMGSNVTQQGQPHIGGFGGVSVLNHSPVNQNSFYANSPTSPTSPRGGRRTSYGTPQRQNGSSPRNDRRSFSNSYRNNGSTPFQSSPNSTLTALPISRTPASPTSRLIAGLEPDDPNLKTQNISFPADMIGCIIGRGGTKIQEIRKLSGSRINISKEPNAETGERLFSIVGTTESNEKALFLLYSSLEAEKERRAQDNSILD